MSSNKKNSDIYGDLDKDTKGIDNPLIPAATVVLLRETAQGQMQVLMLQKNLNISFGGMWVFPGGRIDDGDYSDQKAVRGNLNQDLAEESMNAARRAAVREAEEETGIKLDSEDFVYFAHWSPPASTPKRFATWFFVATVSSDQEVNVDGEEILNHRWVDPIDAIQLQADGKIDLAPPTWISLYHVGRYKNAKDVLSALADQKDKIYETCIVKNELGVRVALWAGDAGYDEESVDVPGGRHRLVLEESGFVFENTVEQY
ncbi:MAG: 8-oxo-dGTP pyrophosphatase MutT (NUDIX family) [Candidatus Azotimanducaceae bacterium]|jgi:8-oxo-dGTP pyrophosphatase MutT (NUDIX family)